MVGSPGTPYNHNQGNQGSAMTEEHSRVIKQNALAGRSEALVPLIDQARGNLAGETAKQLETVWLKHGAHALFHRTKGDVSIVHDDMPDLAADEPVAALDTYQQTIANYLNAFNSDVHSLLGAGLATEEERRDDSLVKLLSAVQDWRDRGEERAPIGEQLAVVADKPWDNDRLREVIYENWAGGVKQGLWTIASVTGAEAQQRLAAGEAQLEVAGWYRPAAEQLFGEVFEAVDNAISETQPRPTPYEEPS